MIDVFSKGAKGDPEDLLNLRVRRFDAVAVHPGQIIGNPGDLIPDLKARLTPKKPMASKGYGYGGSVLIGTEPTVDLHLANATIRQILNATSEATEQFPAKYSPFGWIYSFSPDPKSPLGGHHSWNGHLSVPHNWKEEAEKGNRRLQP